MILKIFFFLICQTICIQSYGWYAFISVFFFIFSIFEWSELYSSLVRPAKRNLWSIVCNDSQKKTALLISFKTNRYWVIPFKLKINWWSKGNNWTCFFMLVHNIFYLIIHILITLHLIMIQGNPLYPFVQNLNLNITET